MGMFSGLQQSAGENGLYCRVAEDDSQAGPSAECLPPGNIGKRDFRLHVGFRRHDMCSWQGERMDPPDDLPHDVQFPVRVRRDLRPGGDPWLSREKNLFRSIQQLAVVQAVRYTSVGFVTGGRGETRWDQGSFVEFASWLKIFCLLPLVGCLTGNSSQSSRLKTLGCS
jgi:hypothetical protein